MAHPSDSTQSSTRRGATTATLPPITIGTRLTDFGTLDLTVKGTDSGGMGQVVWGPNAALGGEMIAAKMIRPDRAASAGLRSAFEQEALIWCHLWPHAFIIHTLGLYRLPGWNRLPVLELEYAPGGNIRRALNGAHQQGNFLAPQAAFGWGQQIAAALAAIHTPDPEHERPHPLVHCDLKPENVLLDERGRAKLTDLGLSRVWAADSISPTLAAAGSSATSHGVTSSGAHTQPNQFSAADLERLGQLTAGPDVLDPAHLTRSVRLPALPGMGAMGTRGAVVGTLPYMPPEQWQGIDAVVPASDVYALGVMLFELFAGVTGFPHVPSGQSRAGWYAAHLAGPTRRLTDPNVRALTDGPLVAVVLGRQADASASEATRVALAQEVLGGLDGLIRACLEPRAGMRPTAAEVQARLGELAEQIGERHWEVTEETPHIPFNEATFWTNLAITYGEIGQYDAKLRLQRRAVDTDPSNPVNWVELAAALNETGRNEESLEAYAEAERRLTPEYLARVPALASTIPFNRGNTLSALGREGEAAKAYEQSLVADPGKMDALDNLAATYWQISRQAQQPAERIRLLRAALAAAERAAPHLALAEQRRQAIVAELRQAEQGQ